MNFIYNSPFEQFKVFDLVKVNYNFVLSNSLLQLTFVFFFFSIISYFVLSGSRKQYEIPLYYIIFKELYFFIYNTMFTYLGRKTGSFFPFIFYIFLFIFICNAIGLVPYSFTVTSHFAITFGLGFMVWFGIILIGFREWGLKFFALFFPKGASVPLIFFLSVIEFISTMFRVFSLSLRLLANMVAGHILLDCIAFFIFKLVFTSVAGSSISFISIVTLLIPVVLLVVLLLFEVCVAVLQAYIFIILSCIYLKEVI
jgi:ATP synthase subunit 6